MKQLHLSDFRNRISIYQSLAFTITSIVVLTLLSSSMIASAEDNIRFGKVTINNQCHWPSSVHFYSYDRPFQCVGLPKNDNYIGKRSNRQVGAVSEVKNLFGGFDSCGFCVEPLGSFLSCSGQHIYPATQTLGVYFEFEHNQKEVSITCKTLSEKYTSAQPDNCFCMQDPWPPEWKK